MFVYIRSAAFIIVVTQKLVLQQSKYVTAKCTETLLPPPCIQFSLEITIFKLEFFVLNHGYWNRVSQRGSRTNERSIWYGEKDLYVSDVTDKNYWWRIPSPPKICQSQLCVYSPATDLILRQFYDQGPGPYPLYLVPGYDIGMVQRLESLELYDYLTLFQYPCIELTNIRGRCSNMKFNCPSTRR